MSRKTSDKSPISSRLPDKSGIASRFLALRATISAARANLRIGKAMKRVRDSDVKNIVKKASPIIGAKAWRSAVTIDATSLLSTVTTPNTF